MAKKVKKTTKKASPKKTAAKAKPRKAAKKKSVAKKTARKKTATGKKANKAVKKRTAVSKAKKKKATKKTTKKKTAAKKKTSRKTRTRASRTAPLTKEEIVGFRMLLLEKRAELVGDVNYIENEALRKSRGEAAGDLSSMPIHMADVAGDYYEREFTLSLVESKGKQ